MHGGGLCLLYGSAIDPTSNLTIANETIRHIKPKEVGGTEVWGANRLYSQAKDAKVYCM